MYFILSCMKLDKKRARLLYKLMMLQRNKQSDRSGLSRSADLSPVSVTRYLKEFLASGIAVRRQLHQSGSGHPRYWYQITGGEYVIIGASVFRDRIDVNAYTLGGSPLITESVRCTEGMSSSLVSRACRTVIEDPALRSKDVFVCGVGLPGMVDSVNGMWLQGLQVPDIDQEPLAAQLESELDLPVFIEDSTRCLALHEAFNEQNCLASPLVLLNLDIGVGTGIITNGDIFRGHHGLAGEIGHIVVDPSGYRCSCGLIGCLETVASVPGILRRFSDLLEEGVEFLLNGRLPELTLEHIAAAADAGDRVCKSTLYEIGLLLGDACTKLINLFNPQRLVFSGPGSSLHPYFRDAVWRQIETGVHPQLLKGFDIGFADFSSAQYSAGAARFAFSSYLFRLASLG